MSNITSLIRPNEVPDEFLNDVKNIDCVEGLSKLPDNCIDLAVVDPPYFKTVNETWDYEWRTVEDYVNWCQEWLTEISRVSKVSGTIYLFGYFRNLSHLVPKIENENYNIRQQIIVDKGMQAVGGRATRDYKLWPNTTEEILFAVYDSRPVVKAFLNERNKEMQYSSKEINEMLGAETGGGGLWSIYAGDNIMGKVPPRDKWNILQEIFEFDIKHEDIHHTFNTEMGLSNVWTDIDFYNKERKHPTQKPLKLVKRLIKASSNKGMTVLDPFAGSGSTLVAANELERDYVGFEIDEEYYEASQDRLGQFRLSNF